MELSPDASLLWPPQSRLILYSHHRSSEVPFALSLNSKPIMTSSISQRTISGRDQMSVAPVSPLRRNPPPLFDSIPEVPAIPPRLDGYQRSRGVPRITEPYQPANGDTTGKAEPPSPRAMQIPLRSRSVHQVADMDNLADTDVVAAGRKRRKPQIAPTTILTTGALVMARDRRQAFHTIQVSQLP